jgi:hypothetical protein
MKKILVTLILFVTVDTALACNCLPLTFEQEVQLSNSIFYGRVIAVDKYKFDIEVIHVWKGEFTTSTFQLIQGETSCEKRTFELNKEYLFYLKGKSVFNCSRSHEYQSTMDPELLDLKFENIGDKKLIKSNSLTDRELDVLKFLLRSENISPVDIADKKVLFAIQDKWVDKWTFFDSYRRSDLEIKLTKLNTEKNLGTMLFWTGNDWKKASKKLKQSM